jgi:hemoglobin-like flavoprotein
MVINAVAMAVNNLGDLEPVVANIRKLGLNHAKRGILPEHYPVVG